MSRVGVWGVSKPEGLGKCCYILGKLSRAWSFVRLSIYVFVDTLDLSLSPGSKVGRIHRVFSSLVPAFVRSVCVGGFNE